MVITLNVACLNPFNQVNCSNTRARSLYMRVYKGLNPFNQVNCSNLRENLWVSPTDDVCLNPFNQVNCSNGRAADGFRLVSLCLNPFNQVNCSNDKKMNALKEAQEVS